MDLSDINKAEKYQKQLLQLMIDNGATDMYLSYGEPPTLRVDENIYKINQLPEFGVEDLSALGYMFMNDFEGEQFRENLDIDLGRTYNGRRFRVNISNQQKSVMIVVRLLAGKVPTLEEFNLPGVFSDFIQSSSGIILVAGPTGSGKSSTLAAMIEEININHSKHIITIEDPIEYVFDAKQSLIEQKQLGTDVISFPRALRSALRQKPDVILFGEMRDLESIQNAITLAETGHLVLSTIHSRSSGQTISKIIDSFPVDQQNQVRLQLSETLKAVISQRLIKNKNGKGMVAAHEIMTNTYAVSNLIKENQIKQLNNIIQTNKGEGMILLEEKLIELLEENEISKDDALAIANNPEYIKNEIKTRGIIIE